MDGIGPFNPKNCSSPIFIPSPPPPLHRRPFSYTRFTSHQTRVYHNLLSSHLHTLWPPLFRHSAQRSTTLANYPIALDYVITIRELNQLLTSTPGTREFLIIRRRRIQLHRSLLTMIDRQHSEQQLGRRRRNWPRGLTATHNKGSHKLIDTPPPPLIKSIIIVIKDYRIKCKRNTCGHTD